jgi:ELWxxDGT repeat protein
VNGVELWHSDGTNFGTSLIQDIWPGELGPGSPNSANPTRLTYGNAALFFIAEEGEHGRELWTLKFPDADGDSLLDSWEANGIDYDHNGTVDLNLAAIGALPGQKDLFVEIDYMVGAGTDNHTPLVIGIQYAALADVAAQFAAHGVTFHFLVDENIGHVMAVNFMGRSPAAMDDFDDLKQTWFGTSAQRAAANAANILGARRLVYRYVIYGHHHNHPPDSSGIAEIGGNDLMVTLGAWDDADLAADGGKRMVESGTFMHEFGHSLVLLHGGGDSINCKPNYFSVMSYAMQLGRFTLRPLDYSGQVLATLNENGGLNEPSGVGGPAGRHTVFGVAGDAHTDAANGALDWNDDGDKTDPNVIADPNHLLRAGCNATPNQTLPGFDDWANLIFNFRMSSDFADGARIFVPVTPELDAAGAGGKAWLPIVPHLP